MKNAGIILKAGIAAFAVLVVSTSCYAQSNKKAGNDKTATEVQTLKSSQLSQVNNNSGREVPNAQLNPKLAAQKRAAVQVSNEGSSARNCTTKKKENPYAISRSVFNSLPKDRQQFVLDNLNKYTIVD